jgi:hypothetical protein
LVFVGHSLSLALSRRPPQTSLAARPLHWINDAPLELELDLDDGNSELTSMLASQSRNFPIDGIGPIQDFSCGSID